MKPIDLKGALSEVFAKAACVPNDGDWISEDGFVHCRMCSEAKEMEVTVLEKTIKVRRECACDRSERERREAEEERRNAAILADRRRRDCFYDHSMFAMTFAADDKQDAKTGTASMKYVEKFDAFKAEGKGLLFYGSVGTGKTFFAAAIANALVTAGYRVKFTSFARLGNAIQSTFDGKQGIIDSLRYFDLVVLDDLGTERKTDTMNEHAYQIVNTLYEAGVPMVITTNLPLDTIKKPDTAAQQRIYDRVLERCFPVEVQGANRRLGKAIDDYGRMKEMLGL